MIHPMRSVRQVPNSVYSWHQFSILAGLVPLFLFTKVLFYVQGQALGPESVMRYNNSFVQLREMPFFILSFLFCFVVPLIFHCGHQLIRFYRTRTNLSPYFTLSNLVFWLHQVSFIVTLLFLIFFTTSFFKDFLIAHSLPDYLSTVRWFEVPWHVWVYGLGGAFLLLYFWTSFYFALIEWGFIVRQHRRKQVLSLFLVGYLWGLGWHGLIMANFAYHYESPPVGVQWLLGAVKGLFFW